MALTKLHQCVHRSDIASINFKILWNHKIVNLDKVRNTFLNSTHFVWFFAIMPHEFTNRRIYLLIVMNVIFYTHKKLWLVVFLMPTIGLVLRHPSGTRTSPSSSMVLTTHAVKSARSTIITVCVPFVNFKDKSWKTYSPSFSYFFHATPSGSERYLVGII